MRLHRFGNTAREVAVIGQGTWYIEQADRADAVAALLAGLDRGMDHIDTAEMYGDGEAERVVGDAIEGRRDEVFLVSKVLPQNASRRGTIAACNRSLANLVTDHLDCYLLHWRGSYPLAETFAAFELLRGDGKILSWGVSNFDADDMQEALIAAGGARRAGQLVCNQVLYNIETRAIEHEVMPWCRQQGVAIVAYSPLGHSHFPDRQSPAGRVLAEIGTDHDATPRQVALAFVTRRPSVFAIPKASKSAHAEENAGAGDLVLTPEEIARIDKAFPVGPKPGTLPML